MRVLCCVHNQAFEWGRLRGAMHLCDKNMLILWKHSVQFEERLELSRRKLVITLA